MPQADDPNQYFDFFEDDEQQENEADLLEAPSPIFGDVSISATDWTTETVVTQINKGNILLNPSFQRRDAWTKNRKSSFIESLILGMPVPQLVLAQAKGRPGQLIVLDGKQRLLALRQFCAPEGDEVYQQLKLTDLKIRTDLHGLAYADLQSSLKHKGDVAQFENQSIRTVIIRNWPGEEYLYHVFLRLNTGSLPLSPQELRQALHPGPFVDFIEEASRTSRAMRDIFGSSKPDFRMRDAELLVRFYAYTLNLAGYSGNLKALLDQTCMQFNREWDETGVEIAYLLEQFEDAHWMVRKIFGVHAYRKWSGSKFERPFNRAIFDAMMSTFHHQEVRASAEDKVFEIKEAFKHLCSQNEDFRASIEQTTKSIQATSRRLNLWRETLEHILEVDIPEPAI